MAARSVGPAQLQLDQLQKVFGPEYFQRGRLVLTVARDLPGVMKVAHKFQAKVNESFGAVVEVIMEHVKHEWWLKLHETTTTVGLQKGNEVPDVQVTSIPEGIRVHPYKRGAMPTLEALLLWEDATGATRGHCMYTMTHPEVPSLDQVDNIFKQVEPYFAMRWIIIELRMAPPIKGEFDEEPDAVALDADLDVGEGVAVSVLACHAYGFARGQDRGEEQVAHVTQCQPMTFQGVSDASGRAQICFLPAEVNKIQVAETERFHGTEMVLHRPKMSSLGDGPTVVPVELTPKALAVVTVHVFELPRQLPSADDTDGIIDWAAEERRHLEGAVVEVNQMKDGQAPVRLKHRGDGVFTAEGGGLPEGCVNLTASCTGYEEEEKPLFLLVGTNEFYVPLRKGR